MSLGAALRYLGAYAPRPLAYGVASFSGSILAAELGISEKAADSS